VIVLTLAETSEMMMMMMMTARAVLALARWGANEGATISAGGHNMQLN